MKEKILNRWIKALRSGEYLVSTNQSTLVKIDGDKHIFHPLAVLADLAPQRICDFGKEVGTDGVCVQNYVPIIVDDYKYITTIPNILCDWADVSTRCAGPSYISKWPKALGDNIESIIEWMKKEL